MGFKGIPGHEFVGVSEKINSEDQSFLGKRVVGEINCGCGVCSYCLNGLKNHCPNRRVLSILNKDGAFAEYLSLPIDNLFEVPKDIEDEEAVFVEPLAAAFQITNQLHIKPTDKILALGDGKLGLSCSFVLNLTFADITLAGKHKDKLEIAGDQGIKTVLCRDIEKGKVYDIVIEATGSSDGFEKALQMVRPKGIIVLKSTTAKGKELNLTPVVVNEINVIGSRCGPFEPVLKVLSDKSIDVNPLITEIFNIDRAVNAVERAKDKGSLKVIIEC